MLWKNFQHFEGLRLRSMTQGDSYEYPVTDIFAGYLNV